VNARVAAVLPVLVAALALGAASRAWALAAFVGALSIALAAAGQRWELDRGRQLVTSLLGAMIGYAATAVAFEHVPGKLTEGWTKLAAASLLAAAARLPQLRPAGGAATTVALAYVGLLAAGGSRGAGGYPGLVAAFLMAALLALRVDDRGRPDAASGGGRGVAAGAGLLLVAAGISAGATLGLRAANAAMMRRAGAATAGWISQKGFSDPIEVGALDGLLDSATVVLRVRGPQVDYLRGAAFDLYEGGRWLRSDGLEKEARDTWSDDLSLETRVVEIEAVSDRADRFFLPLEAGPSALSPAAVLVDGVGAVKPATRGAPPVARVVLGPRARGRPAPPGRDDLALGRRARGDLRRIAREWTSGADSPAEKLDAIERHLSAGYQYSLSVPRGNSYDPVLDFLLRDRRGHCELFASAMVLVARAAGVPARMVAGYRVAERSPFDDHWLVRERNAHAWVEAWVDGQGWVRRDPTPEASVPQNQPHTSGYAAALADAARVRYDRLTAWLGKRTLAQTSIAVLLGFGLLAWVIARGARGRGRRLAPRSPDEAPLPCLAALLDALSRAGHVHDETEPLERLAARLPDARAAALLRQYAALRYGGAGDASALAREMGEHAASLRYGAASAQQRNP
jgi:protein-glutamine gamma-glutamyltransferase